MMDVSGWAKWVKATGRYRLSEDMDKVWAVNNNNVSKLAHCDKHMLLLLSLGLRRRELKDLGGFLWRLHSFEQSPWKHIC